MRGLRYQCSGMAVCRLRMRAVSRTGTILSKPGERSLKRVLAASTMSDYVMRFGVLAIAIETSRAGVGMKLLRPHKGRAPSTNSDESP